VSQNLASYIPNHSGLLAEHMGYQTKKI